MRNKRPKYVLSSIPHSAFRIPNLKDVLHFCCNIYKSSAATFIGILFSAPEIHGNSRMSRGQCFRQAELARGLHKGPVFAAEFPQPGHG